MLTFFFFFGNYLNLTGYMFKCHEFDTNVKNDVKWDN